MIFITYSISNTSGMVKKERVKLIIKKSKLINYLLKNTRRNNTCKFNETYQNLDISILN